jgi:hypothetical protein
MSYYVLPDYWVAGYAEGDAIELSATILSALSLAASVNGVANLSALIEPMLTQTASANRVLSIDPQPSTGALTYTSEIFFVKSASASIQPFLSIVADPSVTFSASSFVPILSDASANATMILIGRANVAGSCIITASSRFFWIDEGDTAEIWTDQANTGEIWTPQSDTAETWAKV